MNFKTEAHLNFKSVYIAVLGLIALAGVLAAAFAAKLDSNTTVIAGALVIAGVAVGALATMAREIHEHDHYDESPPPARPYSPAWQTEDSTRQHPTVD